MYDNKTILTYFILKGISDVTKLQVPIFLLILLLYLITLGSNLTILLLVFLDSQLRTPMYFFLCNLSILDICSATVTQHKILFIFVTEYNRMSYTDCMVQVYMFSGFSANELLLLTAMSYDRYAAICNPLHYSVVMRGRVCHSLAIFCWSISFVLILPAMITLFQLSCYNTNIVNHFFCDIIPLISISCSDTSIFEVLLFTEGILLMVLTPFLLTFISYGFIIASIMRIKSSKGRYKAFYTCSSHITLVTLHYTILICQYFTPSGMHNFGKFLSLFNTAVIPALNPLIYSLKNKDVKSALQRQLKYLATL